MDPVTALLAVQTLIGSSTIVHVLFDTLIDSVVAQAKNKIISLPIQVQQTIKENTKSNKSNEINDFLYINHPLLLPYHKQKYLKMLKNDNKKGNNNNDNSNDDNKNDDDINNNDIDIMGNNALILDFDNKYSEIENSIKNNNYKIKKNNKINRKDYELQFCDDLLKLVTKKLQKMEVN